MLTVRISARAEGDIERILRFLRKRSTVGAVNWLAAFRSMLELLPEQVTMHPLADENAEHLETIRNALFRTRHGRTYRAIYILRGCEIFVTHVRGPGQRRVAREDFYRKSR